MTLFQFHVFQIFSGSFHEPPIFFLPLLQNIHIEGNTPVAHGINGDVFSDRAEVLIDLLLVFGLIFGLEIGMKFL